MITKNSFLDRLISKCHSHLGSVIFPEGDDPRVFEAAKLLLDWNAVSEIVLIHASNSGHGPLKDTRLKSISSNNKNSQKLTCEIYEGYLRRKQKSVSEDLLQEVSKNPLYQSGALLANNDADCVVAGCVATTAEVIRAALSTIGLAENIQTVSGSFIMERTTADKSEAFVFADCGVVIAPSVAQLVDIAMGSCATFEKITNEKPIVAFLSFSTKGSAQHPSAQKMQIASELFKSKMPHVECDGEMQFDAAYITEIGQRKAKGSNVPGRANCFIFPDLNAGNIAYKITERLGGFGAYGPILQGLAKPYSDLSRGASAQDIAISALINILRSH